MIELDQIPVMSDIPDTPRTRRPGFAARSREVRQLLEERERLIATIEELRQENRMLRDMASLRGEREAG